MGRRGVLWAGRKTMRAVRSLTLEERRRSVGWICWAMGGMEENRAGEEGEPAWENLSFPVGGCEQEVWSSSVL